MYADRRKYHRGPKSHKDPRFVAAASFGEMLRFRKIACGPGGRISVRVRGPHHPQSLAIAGEGQRRIMDGGGGQSKESIYPEGTCLQFTGYLGPFLVILL